MSTVAETQKFPGSVLSIGGEPMFCADLIVFQPPLFIPLCSGSRAGADRMSYGLLELHPPRDEHITRASCRSAIQIKTRTFLFLTKEGRDLGTGEVGEIAVRSRYISPGIGAILIARNPYSRRSVG